MARRITKKGTRKFLRFLSHFNIFFFLGPIALHFLIIRLYPGEYGLLRMTPVLLGIAFFLSAFSLLLTGFILKELDVRAGKEKGLIATINSVFLAGVQVLFGLRSFGVIDTITTGLVILGGLLLLTELLRYVYKTFLSSDRIDTLAKKFKVVLTLLINLTLTIGVAGSIVFLYLWYHPLLFKDLHTLVFISGGPGVAFIFAIPLIITFSIYSIFHSKNVLADKKIEVLKKKIKRGTLSYYRKYYRVTKKWVLIAIIVSLLFLPLSFFNYTKVTSEGLYYNPYIGVQETFYSWDDATKVAVIAESEYIFGEKKSVNKKYEVTFTDGTTFNLWKSRGFLDHANDLHKTFRDQGTPIYITILDEETKERIIKDLPSHKDTVKYLYAIE